MRRQLKLRRVAVAVAINLDAARKRRSKSDRHVCGGHDRRALLVFEAEDQLRGSDARRLIELPLQHGATLNSRLLRIHALPFTESQLIRNVSRQVSESRQHDRDLGLKLEIT